MKILMVTGVYRGASSGVADYCGHLVDHLRLEDLEIEVLTHEGKHCSHGESIISVDGWGRSSLIRTLERTEIFKPDCVHLQYQTDIYDGGVFPMRLAAHLRKRNIPLVATFHDTHGPRLFPRAGRLRKIPVRAFLRNTSVVIVSNEGDMNELLRMVDDGPAYSLVPVGPGILPVTLSPLERRHIRDETGTAEGPLIGHFGFLHRAKGVEILMEAFSIVAAQISNAGLAFIGGLDWKGELAGYRSQLEARTRMLGIDKSVKWLPTMPAGEASKYIHACDLMVLPYEDGVSGRRSSFYTVLAHGLPIVTTRGRNMPEDLQHGHNVWLSDSLPGNLAEGIRAILLDDKLRGRITAGAQSLAGRFSWGRIAAEHAAIYAALSEALAS